MKYELTDIKRDYGGTTVYKIRALEDIENKNMPSNQYGKTSVKIKESLIETDVKKHKKKFKNFLKCFFFVYFIN